MLQKGVTFQWMEQCNNAFKLLKSMLVKMPALQYPNPNKPLRLFTDASKHSYTGILHQEETPKTSNTDTNLVPIAYFLGSFSRTQQLWNTIQKECYTVYQSIHKFAFCLTGTDCTLYCDCKPLAPFFTNGMSSPLLDRLDLELQQFNFRFQQIQGKRNVVADAISCLRTLVPYQDSSNEDIPVTREDVMENIIEEVHPADVIQMKQHTM